MMHFPQGVRGFVSALAAKFVPEERIMRRRTVAPGMIEACIRRFSEDFLPGSACGAGPAFTWLGSFPGMAKRYTLIQLELGNYKVHPHHEEEAQEVAEMVAAECALRDPAKAGCALPPSEPSP